mmetsp:Transcript_4720/g.13094  ORF Transcript_4720/g.13094 Transcript_4720/m.13094 type:complete len:226 (-) Transcript_4720:646-1323(-)
MSGQLVPASVGDESFRVHHIDCLVGILFGHSIIHNKVSDHVSHPSSRAPSAVEHNSHILHIGTLSLHTVDKAAEHHRPSPLNVIVETQDTVSHALQDGKRSICPKVLKLYKAAGPALTDCVAQLLHGLQMFLPVYPRSPFPKIKLVQSKLLPVCATIEGNRQAVLGCKATSSHIERYLPNRYPHSIGTQVAQSKNAATICYHNDLDIRLGRVLKQLCKLALVLEC